MPTFLLKYGLQIGAVLLVVFAGFFVYKHIYNSGYREAEVKYQAEIKVLVSKHEEEIKILVKKHEEQVKTYETKVSQKVEEVILASNNIAIEIQKSTVETNNNIAILANRLKGKKLFTVINGKCSATKEFNDAVNTIVREANKK